MNGMNWEKSKVLTALKKDFLKEFFLVENRFFLTGGSALGIFYFEHRYSYDLDFFTINKSIDWKHFESILRNICDNISAEIEPVTRSPSFQRFQLRRGNEHEILDFVIEWVEQIDLKKNKFGSIIVDTIDEIGTNKICTLLGRSEVKDVIDLYFLSKNGFDIISHIELAMKKDGGLNPAILSYIVSGITINELPEYLIEKLSIDDLNSFISNLKNDLAKFAFPK